MRAALERERHTAERDLTGRQLRLGRHTLVLASLAAQSSDHPLDERVAGQFMLALYRSGQATDALGEYQRLCARLADELGADPSPALQLHPE
jgi:DNA-binding SARP family transcriptional activator